MNKTELITAMAEASGLTKKDCDIDHLIKIVCFVFERQHSCFQLRICKDGIHLFKQIISRDTDIFKNVFALIRKILPF